MARKLAKKQPEILRYEELEPRVLFSADLMPGLDADSDAVYEQVLVEDVAGAVQTQPLEVNDPAVQTEDIRHELVFVNENVADYQQLIDDLGQGDDNRFIEVVVLDADRDGIEQVSEILADRSELDAVHFITHGADGAINLGSSWLNNITLNENSDAVASWGNSLTETGDILFYGCNLAETEKGQDLTNTLAELTGADVAASDDLTGNAQLGGDWELEYSTGSIEASVAVSGSAQANYEAILELLSNPGFESDYTNWDLWGAETITSDAYAGTKAASVDVDGMMQQVSGTAGTEYTLTAWAKKTTDFGWANIAIGFYDAGGNNIGWETTEVTSTTGYEQYTVIATAPANTAYVGAAADREYNTGGALVVDEFSLLDINDAPTLTAFSHNPTFTENGASVQPYGFATADPIESGQTIEELVFTVTNVTDGNNELITLDGSTFALADLVNGTTTTNAYGYFISLTGSTATITLTTTGATVANIANLVGSLNYENSSESPSTLDRVFTITSITDSGGTANGGIDTTSLNLVSTVTVVAVNDAPVLTNGNGLFLSTITEDDINNSGNTVAEILASSGADPITDVDAGAVEGIALTDFDSGNGAWEYNVGSGWVPVGTVSFTESLLLRATDSLRFVPDGLNADLASVTFEAWDQTTGTAGTKVDTSLNFGGTTAFSSTVEAATINVTTINDPPTLAVNTGISINEGSTGNIITTAMLNEGDPDDDGTGIIYTLDAVPNNGRLYLDGAQLAEAATFTQADIDLSRLTYDHNGTATTSDSFNFTIADGGEDGAGSLSGTFSIVISAPNDAPVVTNIDGDVLNYNEGDGAVVLDQGVASQVTDVDSVNFDGGDLNIECDSGLQSSEDVFAIRNQGTGSGQIGISGTDVTYEGVVIGTFTGGTGLAPLNILFNSNATSTAVGALLQNITYENTNNNNPVVGARGLTIDLSDGDGGSIVTQNMTVTVTAVNDSPTVGGGTLPGISEDTLDPAGETIGTLFAASFADVDSGSSMSGILITSNPENATQGVWQYSTDDGVNWYDVGPIAYPDSLSLDVATKVRFVPAADYNGTATGLSLRALDNTYAGGFTSADSKITYDASSPGGTTPISSSLVSINTVVSAINDAPTLTAFAHNPTFTENGASVQLYGFATADPIESGQTIEELVFSVTNVTDGNNELITLDGSTFALANLVNGATTTNAYGYSVSLTGSTATITLTTTGATVANIANLVGSLNYENSSENPSTLNRVFTITSITDSGGILNGGIDTTSLNMVSTVTVVATNDAPIAVDDRPALNFDGFNDYVQVADDLSLNMSNTLTMEAWINPSGLGTGSQLILNKEGEYELGIIADTGQIIFAIAQDVADPAPDTWAWHYTGQFVTLGEWSHVAVTYDGDAGEVNTYINGILVDTYVQSGPIGDVYTGYNDLIIGGRGNDTDERFDGQIADVRVWNTVRTPTEINDNQNVTLTGSETGLVGYWLLNDGSGTDVVDSSDAGNDGVLSVGLPTWSDFTVDEDGTLTVSAPGILLNDYDADGDTLSAVLVSDVSNGALTLNADGSFSYIPNTNFNGTDSFTYTANDGTIDSNIATVTITVNAVNDAPVASDNAYTVDEDSTLTTNDWNLNSADWPYRQTITFDNSGQTENLTDFAVLVKLDATRIDYSHTQDDGGDLRFFDSDGTQLEYEIEKWDKSGDSFVWVKVPQIDAGSTTDSILMYYGNATAASGESPTSVWDSNYVGVWHLGEEQAGTGTADLYKDSTSNNNDGDDNVASTDQGGAVGDGQQFSNTGESVDIAHSDELNLTDEMTISFWIKPTEDSGTFDRVIEKGLWGYQDSFYFGGGDGTNDLTFYLNNQAVFDTADNVLTVGDWQQATVTYASNGDATLFLNGVSIASGTYTGGAFTGNTGDLHISFSNATYGFAGNIDEVRISNTARSDDWVSAQYLSMSDTFASFGVEETTALPDGVRANDTDADGDALTVNTTPVTDVSHGSLTLSSDGSFIYTPTADFNGTDSFTYEISDGNGGTDTADVTITVNPVNDAPVITASQTFSLSEFAANGFSLGNAVATDADTGTSFSAWTITGGNGDGIFAINASTGEITVADNSPLDFDTTAGYTLSLTVSDGINASATETVTITVTDVSTAITAAQSFSVVETAADGTAVGSVATTGDSPQTFAITAGNTGSAFAIDNSGNITVNDTLAIDYETLASYALTIQASDGTTPVSETVTINVTNANDNTPLINDVTTSVSEDAANTTSVTNINEANTGNDTDLDGEALAYSITAGNADGIFAINSAIGEITVTDNTNLDYETTSQYILTVNVTDGTNSDTAAITIDVTNVNDNVPLISDVTTSVAEDAANLAVVTNINEGNTGNDTDLDGEALTYSITAGNGDNIFAINAATGEITVTDNTNLDYETTQQYILTVETSDGTNSDTAAITIDVTNINDNAPLINDATTSVSENAANTTSVTNINEANTGNDTDLDGESLTYSITAGNADSIFAIDANTGEITVTDNTNLDYETTQQYVLTISASDGANTDTAAITINVTNVNDNAPLINDATTSVNEDAINTTSVTNINEANTGNDTDLDGEALAYSITAGNGAGIFAIDGSTGEITVTDNTNLDYETTQQYTLTVNATDGTNSDTAAITIDVTNVNDNTPLINDATTSIAEDAANATSVTNVNDANTGNDTDLDGEALAYSITAGNTDGIFAINSSTGEITVADNTNLDYETTQQYILTVDATDGTNSDTAAITVDVTNANDNVPLINDVTTSVSEDAANGISVTDINEANTGNDTDLDGEALAYSITAGNSDNIFAINSATGEITVADNTNLDYETTQQYVLTVNATDGTNNDTAAITINVVNVNDNTPLINDATTSVAEDAANLAVVTNINEANTGNDTDLDGEALTYSITAGNADGIFAINAASGEITVTDNTNLDYESTQQYILTVQASDGVNADTAAITVDVTNINDNAPLISDATTSIAEDAVNTTSVTNINEANTGNDTDLDGEALAYSITAGNGDSIFAINASTGEITVADNTNLDYEATQQYLLTIEVSDGSNTDTAAITINVTDVNEFAVGSVTDSNATANTVAEDAANGTVVGITALATDSDGTDTVTYSLSDDAGGLFAIDINTGIITVANALDYETASSHSVTVLATSSDTSTSSQAFTINITDVNESAVGSVSDNNAAANTVAEDAANGTVVGITALATDADGTDTVTYSLSNDAGGLFSIDTNTGVITVNNTLDYETTTSHSVTVLATSSDTRTSSQAFTINVTDVNESAVGAVTDNDGTPNTVTEDAAVGTTVGITALATDADGTDTVTYSLSDDAGGLFTIATNTGIITVANALDYEIATSHSVTVLATSTDGSTSNAAFTIQVTDVNKSAIGSVTDSNAAANIVAEDANVGDTVGITALATDPDSADTVTYSLSDDAGGLFAIDTNTGIITVANALDYETATSHSVTVLATSSDTSTSSQVFTIQVTDVNESAIGSVTDNDGTPNTVTEDAANGTVVGITALATDADGTDTVTYSLSDDAGGLFAIDTNTGVITVANALDYETATSHSVTVLATSTDGSTSNAAFTINVTDVNESAVGAVTDNDAAANTVAEDAANGTVVGITALATDPDVTDTVTYSLSDNAGGLFTIDSNTGVITVANALDYETATSHSVTVLATSSDASTSSQTFTINVTDVNESTVGAISDTDAAVNAANENAIAGTTVGLRANATDPDSGDTVSYSLDDDAGGLFTIDSNTGIVSVAGILDAETASSYNITIRATSSDASFSTRNLSISVNDVDEFNVGPITDSNAIANSVAEDATTGAVVGVTALATDTDITDHVAYSLSDNAGGRFAIDANSGIITVNGALDYELNTSHSVIVLATSSDGSSSNQIFTVNVTDVDEDVPVDDTPTTDPPVEDPDPIEEVTPDDPTPDPDAPTEDLLLDEEPQDFEEITIVPNLTETGELIALDEDPTVELTEEISASVEELRSGSAQERPENDRAYSYFDNNLYKEVLSNNYLDYQYQAPDNVLNLDEFDDFSTIDFDSDNMDKVIANGEYDLLRQEIDEAFNQQFKSEAVKTKVVTMATATFTIGVVSYLLRAGSLAAALASSLPLWRGFDPIIVFTGDKKKEKDPSEISDPDELNPDSLFEDDAE